MRLSYWEAEHYFAGVDFCIAGGGIVGLNAALHLRKKYPAAKILVIEKSTTGAAASTRNAGFACFGSISEILDDVSRSGTAAALDLILDRWDGLRLLRETLGDEAAGFSMTGGYELFTAKDQARLEQCLSFIPELNNHLEYIGRSVYAPVQAGTFQMPGITHMILNRFEGQVHTGRMYFSLEKRCHSAGIIILRGYGVKSYEEGNKVEVVLDSGFSFTTGAFLITINGFASQLISADVQPARAQVLVTEKIPGLNLKGTFHYDEGYYYFRDLDGRILIGGGRNSDFAAETTFSQETSEEIQQRIEDLLFRVILGHRVNIAYRWAGTMGVGAERQPLLRMLSANVACGVRMGGMGVAIGSLVGKRLADMF